MPRIRIGEGPQAADSLLVFAVVHNNGSGAALGVPVEIHDLRTGVPLGTSIVDIAAGGAVTQAPWAFAAPASHMIEDRVAAKNGDDIQD